MHGAAFIPSDGYVDPSALCSAIANAARKYGAQINQNIAVLDFITNDRRIKKVKTSNCVYEVENVILAAGMWSRELGAKLGIKVPSCAVEHQYIITEPTGIEVGHYPTLRDPERFPINIIKLFLQLEISLKWLWDMPHFMETCVAALLLSKIFLRLWFINFLGIAILCQR